MIELKSEGVGEQIHTLSPERLATSFGDYVCLSFCIIVKVGVISGGAT